MVVSVKDASPSPEPQDARERISRVLDNQAGINQAVQGLVEIVRALASDGGVTDKIYAKAWDAYMDAIAATDHKPPSNSGLRAALEAAARAKSGEKKEKL